MTLSLFDTHCDTAYELYHRQLGLDRNDACHVSLEKAACYRSYAQYYAIWSDKRLDDEACWQAYLHISDCFSAELKRLSQHTARVTCAQELQEAIRQGKHAAIPAVEDARLLAGRLERLAELKARGVCYLTLLWSGDTCIGGSHDTNHGLTEFGKAVVGECFACGIIPDISHASEQAVDDLIPIARAYQKPFIASHSDAFSLHPHSRNLRDRHFEVIRDMGGIVGINLCPAHLVPTPGASQRPATAEDVCDHIEYFWSLGGEDTLVMGSDWDGTNLPQGISHVGDLLQVAEILARRNHSDELIEKLFWKNCYQFSMKNL